MRLTKNPIGVFVRQKDVEYAVKSGVFPKDSARVQWGGRDSVSVEEFIDSLPFSEAHRAISVVLPSHVAGTALYLVAYRAFLRSARLWIDDIDDDFAVFKPFLAAFRRATSAGRDTRKLSARAFSLLVSEKGERILHSEFVGYKVASKLALFAASNLSCHELAFSVLSHAYASAAPIDVYNPDLREEFCKKELAAQRRDVLDVLSKYALVEVPTSAQEGG